MKTDRVSSRGTTCSKKLAEITKSESNESGTFSNSNLEGEDVDTEEEPKKIKNIVTTGRNSCLMLILINTGAILNLVLDLAKSLTMKFCADCCF